MILFMSKKKLEEMIDEKLEKLERRTNEKLKNNRAIVENLTSMMARLLITDFATGLLKENDYEINSDIESKITQYMSELNRNINCYIEEYRLQLSEIATINTIDCKRIEIRYIENHFCIDSLGYNPFNGCYGKLIKIDMPNNAPSTNDYKEGDE